MLITSSSSLAIQGIQSANKNMGGKNEKDESTSLLQVGDAVEVLISERGKKLCKDLEDRDGEVEVEVTGQATKQLEGIKAEENVRQQKLDKIDDLKAKLQDESLSEKDKAVIRDDITVLQEETKTKADEINEYQAKIGELLSADYEELSIGDKIVADGHISFYQDQIDKLKTEREEEVKKQNALEVQSRQEKADATADKMKEDEADATSSVDKINGAENIILAAGEKSMDMSLHEMLAAETEKKVEKD